MLIMQRVYASFASGVLLLGLVHTLSTPRALTPQALWFASGGLTMLLTGALNLLNRAYGAAAPGLRRTCIGTNVVMTAFAALSGVVGGATAPQLVVVVGLFAGTTALGLTRHALHPTVPPSVFERKGA